MIVLAGAECASIDTHQGLLEPYIPQFNNLRHISFIIQESPFYNSLYFAAGLHDIPVRSIHSITEFEQYVQYGQLSQLWVEHVAGTTNSTEEECIAKGPTTQCSWDNMHFMDLRGIAGQKTTWGKQYLFVSDGPRHIIYMIELEGEEYTKIFPIVGNHSVPGLPHLGQENAHDAHLNSPHGLALDSEENLLFADTGSNSIRRLLSDKVTFFEDRSKSIVEYVAGCNHTTSGHDDGDGSLEYDIRCFNGPTAISVHPLTGDILVADTLNRMIKLISGSSPHNVSLVAGGGNDTDSTDPLNVDLGEPVDVKWGGPGGDVVFILERSGRVRYMPGDLSFISWLNITTVGENSEYAMNMDDMRGLAVSNKMLYLSQACRIFAIDLPTCDKSTEFDWTLLTCVPCKAGRNPPNGSDGAGDVLDSPFCPLCPEGTIKTDSDGKCISCGEFDIPNRERTACIRCPETVPFQSSEMVPSCVKCPSQDRILIREVQFEIHEDMTAMSSSIFIGDGDGGQQDHIFPPLQGRIIVDQELPCAQFLPFLDVEAPCLVDHIKCYFEDLHVYVKFQPNTVFTCLQNDMHITVNRLILDLEGAYNIFTCTRSAYIRAKTNPPPEINVAWSPRIISTSSMQCQSDAVVDDDAIALHISALQSISKDITPIDAYEWALTDSTVPMANLTDLSVFMSNQTAGVVNIPVSMFPAEFPKQQTFNFSVTVTTRLKSENTFEFTVHRHEDVSLHVAIEDAQITRQIARSSALSLRATASVSASCDERDKRDLSKVKYSWSVVESPLSSFSLRDIPTTRSVLHLPSSVLSIGMYKLRVDATLSGMVATDTVAFEVIPQGVFAVITGGNTTQLISRNIVLHGDHSVDMDNVDNSADGGGQLHFQWMCWRDGESQSSSASTHCNAKVSTNREPKINITSHGLPAGRYWFKLTVKSIDFSRYSSDVAYVDLVTDAPPHRVTIELVNSNGGPATGHKLPKKINPTEPLALMARITDIAPGISPEGVRYLWTASANLALTRATVESQSLEGPYLLLRPNVLRPGEQYTLQVHVRVGTAMTAITASATFMTNRAPVGGKLVAVVSSEGVASKTMFRFETMGWMDEDGDTPLRYRFSFVDPLTNRIVPLGRASHTPHISTMLPPGRRSDNGLLEVIVEAIDTHGATNSARAFVTVRRAIMNGVELLSHATSAINGSLRVELENDSVDTFYNLLLSLLTLLNDRGGRPSDCASTACCGRGTYYAVHDICVCSPDAYGPHCQFTDRAQLRQWMSVRLDMLHLMLRQYRHMSPRMRHDWQSLLQLTHILSLFTANFDELPEEDHIAIVELLGEVLRRTVQEQQNLNGEASSFSFASVVTVISNAIKLQQRKLRIGDNDLGESTQLSIMRSVNLLSSLLSNVSLPGQEPTIVGHSGSSAVRLFVQRLFAGSFASQQVGSLSMSDVLGASSFVFPTDLFESSVSPPSADTILWIDMSALDYNPWSWSESSANISADHSIVSLSLRHDDGGAYNVYNTRSAIRIVIGGSFSPSLFEDEVTLDEEEATRQNRTLMLVECVYWDTPSMEWRSDGCSAAAILPDGGVECHCSHLTDFGVIVRQVLPKFNPLDLDDFKPPSSENAIATVAASVVLVLYVASFIAAVAVDLVVSPLVRRATSSTTLPQSDLGGFRLLLESAKYNSLFLSVVFRDRRHRNFSRASRVTVLFCVILGNMAASGVFYNQVQDNPVQVLVVAFLTSLVTLPFTTIFKMLLRRIDIDWPQVLVATIAVRARRKGISQEDIIDDSGNNFHKGDMADVELSDIPSSSSRVENNANPVAGGEPGSARKQDVTAEIELKEIEVPQSPRQSGDENHGERSAAKVAPDPSDVHMDLPSSVNSIKDGMMKSHANEEVHPVVPIKCDNGGDSMSSSSSSASASRSVADEASADDRGEAEEIVVADAIEIDDISIDSSSSSVSSITDGNDNAASAPLLMPTRQLMAIDLISDSEHFQNMMRSTLAASAGGTIAALCEEMFVTDGNMSAIRQRQIVRQRRMHNFYKRMELSDNILERLHLKKEDILDHLDELVDILLMLMQRLSPEPVYGLTFNFVLCFSALSMIYFALVALTLFIMEFFFRSIFWIPEFSVVCVCVSVVVYWALLAFFFQQSKSALYRRDSRLRRAWFVSKKIVMLLIAMALLWTSILVVDIVLALLPSFTEWLDSVPMNMFIFHLSIFISAIVLLTITIGWIVLAIKNPYGWTKGLSSQGSILDNRGQQQQQQDSNGNGNGDMGKIDRIKKWLSHVKQVVTGVLTRHRWIGLLIVYPLLWSWIVGMAVVIYLFATKFGSDVAVTWLLSCALSLLISVVAKEPGKVFGIVFLNSVFLSTMQTLHFL